MGTSLSLSLAAGESAAPAGIESWTTPDLLGFAHAEQSVDLQSVCDVATEILFFLSGRKFGIRRETARPIAGDKSCGWGHLYARDESAVGHLVLKSPVHSIISVKIDGNVIDPSAYQLYDSRKLVRSPTSDAASQTWPAYQRLDLPDTELGTFSITYEWGQPVTEGAKMACQVFATELAKYINKAPSALADRAISVTRQGVTQTIDTAPFLTGGTGLFFVDAWLKSVNPNGTRSRPRLVSPETAQLLRPT